MLWSGAALYVLAVVFGWTLRAPTDTQLFAVWASSISGCALMIAACVARANRPRA